jgi:flagellar basal-body rod protein FlgB
MDANHIGLFDLAEQRLAWANQRQALLAENIANVNTPGYKPHDIQAFATKLAQAQSIAPARTQPNHLAGTTAPAAPNEVVDRTHLHSADGNAVSLDEQLVKLADTETAHSLVTSIYRAYLGMFNTALGRGAAA